MTPPADPPASRDPRRRAGLCTAAPLGTYLLTSVQSAEEAPVRVSFRERLRPDRPLSRRASPFSPAAPRWRPGVDEERLRGAARGDGCRTDRRAGRRATRASWRRCAKVPRHRFVPAACVAEAYEDHPLPIGEGQTISQPYIVALMTELLDLERRQARARDRHRLRLPGGGAGRAGAARSTRIEIVEPLARRRGGDARGARLRRMSRSAPATATAAGRRRRRSTRSS